jgi:thiol-disulfide isomerase/thioredoxin
LKARGPFWALALALVVMAAAVGLLTFDVGGTDSGADSAAAPKRPGLPLSIHEQPQALDRVTFDNGAGETLALADFRGQIVVLNLWATWCPPCRKEMPTLDALQQRLGGDDFQVIALSVDQGGAEAVRDFYDQIGIEHLPLYVDSSMRAMSRLAVRGLPTTLVLDAQGRELARLVGETDWAAPEMIDYMRELTERGNTDG